MYITPSTTSGVHCRPPSSTPVSKAQTGTSLLMLPRLISSSGLYRHDR